MNQCTCGGADEEDDYICSRSMRYRGAMDLAPEWTQELMADEHLAELSPYPALTGRCVRVRRLLARLLAGCA